MAEPISIKFDVTDYLPRNITQGHRIEIATWLFVPSDPTSMTSSPVLMTLLHGGSYDKRYHDIHIPGRTGYSCTRHLADLGNIVLLPDVLGVSESSRLPVQSMGDRHIVALANHAAVIQCIERLKNGNMVPNLPALSKLVSIGGGHSMGGMITVTQQAAHRTYAGIMVIGYTALGVKNMTSSPSTVKRENPDYILVNRQQFHSRFHWPDVPADVIAADDALCVEVPAAIGKIGVQPGVISADAGTIEVPVYICQSELDNSPAPHDEPACYYSSRDITLHLLENAAHCQAFSGMRHKLWNRMHAWARCIADGIGH